MLLENGARLVMIGDSITDCGRARPVGEGRAGALGTGYVNLVYARLVARHPEAGVHVINTGVSGDQARDLRRRWQSDVLDLKPDWVSVLIGINDVWRGFDSPGQPEKHVALEDYRRILDALVAETLPSVRGIVLMAPYMIEGNRRDPMRARMDEFGAAVKAIASARGAVFVDTQAAFDAALRHVHPYFLAWDRIHPETPGHMIIADAFLGAIGA